MPLPFIRENNVRTKISNDSTALKLFEAMLKENKDIEEIEEYFNIEPNNLMKEEKALKIASDMIEESYKKLSLTEQRLVSLFESNSKNRVYAQLKLVETLATGLKTKKDKEYIQECISTLKNSITKKPFMEAAEKVLELKKTIGTLLEAEDDEDAKEASVKFIDIKIGNFKYIKNVMLAILKDELDSPETIYVTFKTTFYPVGKDFSSVTASLKTLDDKFSRIGRKVLGVVKNDPKLSQVFTGEGIWDASVRINAIKPGTATTGSAEIAMHITPGAFSSAKEVVNAVKVFISKLDAMIPVWFEEVDKTAQKAFMKSKDSNDIQRMQALKKNVRKREADDEKVSDYEDNFGGMF